MNLQQYNLYIKLIKYLYTINKVIILLILPLIIIKRVLGFIVHSKCTLSYYKMLIQIYKNKIFDPVYYLIEYPSEFKIGVNPLRSYLLTGEKKCYNPNKKINLEFIKKKYSVSENILYWCTQNEEAKYLNEFDYLKEQINATNLFDFKYYRKHNPDIKHYSNSEIIDHFIRYGFAERRKPNPSFSFNNSKDLYLYFNLSESTKYNVKIERKTNPLVSIIVPNYNHERFLKDRLDSILNQTYTNYEVILLDDYSTDNSIEILDFYSKKFNNCKLIYNDTNSGSVFKQWKKGLESCNGDLIWIAESDDWCDSDFLLKLISCFNDESVMLSFGNTDFYNIDGKHIKWTLNDYWNDLNLNSMGNFVLPVTRLIEEGWGYKNIIPNGSSVVFRNLRKFNFIDKLIDEKYSVCFDWIFYLSVSLGGCVAFDYSAKNYYRTHDQNTSSSKYGTEEYYLEHIKVLKFIESVFNISELNRINFKKSLVSNCNFAGNSALSGQLSDMTDNLKYTNKDKINILMVGYSFSTGGGEKFPIILSNILKSNGCTVTYLSFEKEDRNVEIRDQLLPSIPVVTNYGNLFNIIEDFDIDIIHSHHAWVDNYIIDSLKNTNIDVKHVVTMHGMYEFIEDKYHESSVKNLYHNASAIVYIADKNLSSFKQYNLLTNNFVKLGNCLDESKINSIQIEDLNIPKDSFVIALISRAIDDKGWDIAIEVAKRLSIKYKNIHLLLIGDGPVYEKLLTKRNPSYIHILGFKPNVQDYYSFADIGILPTSYKGESYPLSLIECIKTDTPFISTDIGEIDNMLRLGSRFAGDTIKISKKSNMIDDFYRIIEKYISTPSYLSHKISNAKYVKSKYSSEKLFSDYYSLYSRVMNE